MNTNLFKAVSAGCLCAYLYVQSCPVHSKDIDGPESFGFLGVQNIGSANATVSGINTQLVKVLDWAPADKLSASAEMEYSYKADLYKNGEEIRNG